ncbi:MAG: hypothetical protein CSA68_12495 [Rhodobacterales bacterium]|nr:MAG: hypothetical protein CSA68_12495 [Rhodobacterales bacterium]
MNGLGPDNAFWIDGEWIGWDSVIDPEEDEYSRLKQLEHEADLRMRYPKADLSLIPYLEDLLGLAESYYYETGKHLNVYGDIGELFGAIAFGIKLHKNNAQGSDGRLGNDFVEIKTISPMSRKERKIVRLDRHFSKLLMVKIDNDFQIYGRLVKRGDLLKRTGNKTSHNMTLSWGHMPGADGCFTS